jgi:trehalose-6-phosphatase
MSIGRFLAFLTLLLGALCFNTPRLFAADANLRLEAVLVWATNVQKTNDTNLKELEPALAKKFRKAYKWNYYYEVRRKEATIAGKEATKVPISEKCALEIKHLGEERVEVRLIGKGKPVARSVESLAHGHLMIVAGEDKNDTAWFVVMRQLPAKK